jgi:hypothetical protein
MLEIAAVVNPIDLGEQLEVTKRAAYDYQMQDLKTKGK